MTTFLDLLFVVVLALAAVSLLAIALMFLVKNKTVKKVCFYLVTLMAVYIGYVGFRINFPGFASQMVLAVLMALIAIAALILERVSKAPTGHFLLARVLASAALVTGMINAFI